MQVKENTNVVQSNFLLENRPKFTLDETRLFLTIIASINKDDDNFTRLKIPVTEFADLWDVESNAAYRKIKTALRGLVQKEFFVEGINQASGKNCFLSMSYVSMATYEQGAGYATIEISEMFKPYLLALKNNYTKYVLKNILRLSTVNAIRNYELMKQYEGLGKRTFSVEEYKKLLRIEDKYSRVTDLRVNVIDPACKEINANTDILVTYELVGRGQKAKISFSIFPKGEMAGLPSEGAIVSDEPPAAELEHDKDWQTMDGLTDFEMDLFEEIPEDVHQGEIERVRAVLDIAGRYIVPTDFMEFYEADEHETGAARLEKISRAAKAAEADLNDRILSAISAYVTRYYNVRKKNIHNPNAHYKYFLVGFEGWLLSNQY